MDLEHLKLILEALKGVGEGALAFGIAWLAVKLLLPVGIAWLIAHTIRRIWQRWCESRDAYSRDRLQEKHIDRAMYNDTKPCEEIRLRALEAEVKAKESEIAARVREAEEKTKQVQAEAQARHYDDSWSIIAGRAGLDSRFLNSKDKERVIALIDKGRREESAKP